MIHLIHIIYTTYIYYTSMMIIIVTYFINPNIIIDVYKTVTKYK